MNVAHFNNKQDAEAYHDYIENILQRQPWWIGCGIAESLRKWNAEGEEQTRKNLVEDAKLYLGTSYRWGGLTPEGVDCSGLVHMIYKLNGLEVFRNSPPKYGFPIVQSDEYTTVDVDFPSATFAAEGNAHVLLQVGKLVGTITIQKVEVFESAPAA